MRLKERVERLESEMREVSTTLDVLVGIVYALTLGFRDRRGQAQALIDELDPLPRRRGGRDRGKEKAMEEVIIAKAKAAYAEFEEAVLKDTRY